MGKNTDAIKRGKEIKAEIDKSIKHHNAKLNSDRALLMELHHRGCADKKNKSGKVTDVMLTETTPLVNFVWNQNEFTKMWKDFRKKHA